jgi:general secretion pathway protein F
MAAFEYVALDRKGKKVKGVQEADTARQVRQILRDKALAPMSVEAVVEKEGRISAKGGSRRSIKASDLALFTRQLATLVGSSLPIEEALKAVSQQTEKSRIKSMIMAVRSRVVEGHTLADAMSDFPYVFDSMFRAMVDAGERSGHLDEVLMRLADYTEQRHQMRQKIMLAMMYPSLLTIVAIGVVSGLLAFVVPKVVEQFTRTEQALPTVTTVLIAISDFIRAHGLVTLIVIVVLVIGYNLAMKKKGFRYLVHRRQLTMPIFGKVIRGLNTARFARTLSILTASGVPLLEGMKIAGAVLTNDKLSEAVEGATDMVREGSSLRIALQETHYFPPMMLHMIASGEKSGELEGMLSKAADNQEREFQNMVSVVLGLFEPLIILLMGGAVLFIILAILLPIFEMNDLVK